MLCSTRTQRFRACAFWGTDMATSKHAVLFDLDGTLVDSVYQHVRIWRDVLSENGFSVPHWKVHRGIGLPSERLLAWLLGEVPKAAKAMSETHDKRMLEQKSTLVPTPGALALLDDLDSRQVPYYVVTSAAPEIRDALFGALGRELPSPAPHEKTGEKPHAQPILAAVQALKLEPAQVTMIGDASWDGESARRAGAHFIGLRCGGSTDELLLQAGALWVEDAPRDLIGRL
jgi:phosphoglycolate phosphatase-like HAD superfamily hydrolase